MLKTNSKKARENIRAYILRNENTAEYCSTPVDTADFSAVAKAIYSDFFRCYNNDYNRRTYPEAEYFARYLLNSKPDYSSYALELALYVKNFVPKSKSEASFSYTLNGKTETVTLNRHYPTLLQLTEEQFANANFAVQSGEIYVLADYVGRVNENDTAPTIKVTKRLSGSMAVGETVTVTIQTEPYCAVYDVVPSCGRLSGSQHGQLVRLFTDKFGKATYKFTVNIEGSYVVECPVAYGLINGRWGIGEKSSIEIGNGNEAM